MPHTWSVDVNPLLAVSAGPLQSTVALEAGDGGEAGAAVPGEGGHAAPANLAAPAFCSVLSLLLRELCPLCGCISKSYKRKFPPHPSSGHLQTLF